MQNNVIYESLKKSEFLSGFNINANVTKLIKRKAGQVVDDVLDDVEYVVMVCEGTASVYSLALDNRELYLNELNKGDCFGISNLLLKSELRTCIICKTNATFLYIPKQHIVETMQNDSNLALKYAMYCNKKINFLISRVEVLTIKSCRGRIIFYLLSHKNKDSKVIIDCNKDEFAVRLAVSRAALYRELAYLQKMQTIEHHKGYVLITNETELKNIFNQLGD